MLKCSSTHGPANRTLRCWCCGEVTALHANACQHCGIPLVSPSAMDRDGPMGDRVEALDAGTSVSTASAGARGAPNELVEGSPEEPRSLHQADTTNSTIPWDEADFERISRMPGRRSESGSTAHRFSGTGRNDLENEIALISRGASVQAYGPGSATLPSRPAPHSTTGAASVRRGLSFYRALGPALAAAMVVIIAVSVSRMEGWLNGQQALLEQFLRTPDTAAAPNASATGLPRPAEPRPAPPGGKPANGEYLDGLPRQGLDQSASAASTPSSTNAASPGSPAAPAGDARSQPAREWSIRAVQEALAVDGYYKGAVDGDVGPLTRSALRAFQRREGLAPTGRIDPAVIRALEQKRERTGVDRGREARTTSRQ